MNFSKLKWALAILLIFLGGSTSFGQESKANWKLRARENYESFSLSKDQLQAKFISFSNTFNFWLERPYDVAYGLAFGPLLMEYPKTSGDDRIGDRMRLNQLGLEYKKWFDNKVFYRGGVYLHYLNLSDSEDLPTWGLGTAFSMGYEIDFDGLGLAFEAGGKYQRFEDGWSITGGLMTIGLHFYELL